MTHHFIQYNSCQASNSNLIDFFFLGWAWKLSVIILTDCWTYKWSPFSKVIYFGLSHGPFIISTQAFPLGDIFLWIKKHSFIYVRDGCHHFYNGLYCKKLADSQSTVIINMIYRCIEPMWRLYLWNALINGILPNNDYQILHIGGYAFMQRSIVPLYISFCARRPPCLNLASIIKLSGRFRYYLHFAVSPCHKTAPSLLQPHI